MTHRLSVFVVCLVIVVTAMSSDAQAQRHPGDLGVGVGTTTLASGLSLKQVAGPTSLQLTAGCWRGCDGIAASLDLLATRPPLVTHDSLLLAWNFGVGGALGIGDDRVGAAGAFVAGLEVILQPVPFDLVLEWRPSLLVLPDVDVEIVTFGGHIRFYP